jgi:hypothetical protein
MTDDLLNFFRRTAIDKERVGHLGAQGSSLLRFTPEIDMGVWLL